MYENTKRAAILFGISGIILCIISLVFFVVVMMISYSQIVLVEFLAFMLISGFMIGIFWMVEWMTDGTDPTMFEIFCEMYKKAECALHESC